jgi:peptidyl-prolyl cis-trans isomerase B (cyclophilin B)
MRRPGTFALAGALLLVLAAAGCGGKKDATTSTTASTSTTTAATTAAAKSGCSTVATPTFGKRNEPKPKASLPAGKTYEITMVTNCGSFTFRIDQAQSPNAAASVVSLVQRGFYNGIIFHRIVPGFVIQGGDPTGMGGGGPGYTTVDTPPKTAAYTHGVVAMAKTGAQAAGAAGSQFFIVTVPNAGLPPDYAIIGNVTKGLAVVDRIGTLGDPSDPAGTPTQTVVIKSATVKVS